jgi:hypothetical protein
MFERMEILIRSNMERIKWRGPTVVSGGRAGLGGHAGRGGHAGLGGRGYVSRNALQGARRTPCSYNITE